MTGSKLLGLLGGNTQQGASLWTPLSWQPAAASEVVAIREAAAETGPVERYLLGQTEAQQVKLLVAIERFAAFGPNYNPQQCKKLKGRASALVELKEKPSRLLARTIHPQ